jgi:lysozyme
MEMKMLEGIDVSHYEPNIDWQVVRANGKHFMYTKASQGSLKDPKFDEHWAEAKAAGMPRGAYHFYDPRYKTANPKRQAEFFWNIVKDDPGELPLCVDIEAFNTGPWHGWRNWYDFIERLNELSGGKEVIIYTGYYFWRDQGGPRPSDTGAMAYFKRYDLFIARYGTNVPLIPKPWDTWTFWQYGDHFILPGVTNELNNPASVDFDYFNGDLTTFNAKYGLSVPEIPTEVTFDVVYNKQMVITAVTKDPATKIKVEVK